MRPWTWKTAVIGVLFAVAIASASAILRAQQPASAPGFGAASAAPDLILTNGKIITVDDRFSIAQAVAGRGDRIVAVGTSQEVARLAGPNTRRIDLRGRAVIPGLIDNHAHLMEEGPIWTMELRLDGVESRKEASQGRLNLRFNCFVSAVGLGTTPEQVEKALPQIAQLKVFQGNNYVDHHAYGEAVYQPLHDNMLAPRTDPRPDQLALWRRIATEVAKAGLPLHVHATIENTITTFLDQLELINKEYPVTNLRWALAHVDQINASHLDRMKNLGMYLAVHTRPTIMGQIFNRAHGDRSYDMPPLKTIQDSGIMWGLGTDTFEVNQYRPFTTLWWAVTGKMVGGTKVLRQTISREDALIAHIWVLGFGKDWSMR